MAVIDEFCISNEFFWLNILTKLSQFDEHLGKNRLICVCVTLEILTICFSSFFHFSKAKKNHSVSEIFCVYHMICVTGSSTLSNSIDTQDVSCWGLYDRYICL